MGQELASPHVQDSMRQIDRVGVRSITQLRSVERDELYDFLSERSVPAPSVAELYDELLDLSLHIQFASRRIDSTFIAEKSSHASRAK